MSATAVRETAPSFTDGLGPMQRLERAQADPEFLESVWQRVLEGEWIGDVAESRGLPKTAFLRWIADEHMAEYETHLRMVGDKDGHDVVKIADESNPDESQKTKLMIGARQWRSSRWFKERYGEHTKVEHTGNVSLIALLGSLPNSGALPIPAITEKVVEQIAAPADDGYV